LTVGFGENEPKATMSRLLPLGRAGTAPGPPIRPPEGFLTLQPELGNKADQLASSLIGA